MSQVIEIQKAPDGMNSAPQAFFQKNNFDTTIWQHGYDVIIEKALRCPCKSKCGDNLSSCKNCGGCGWIFINPKQTKAVLHSMNLQTKQLEWTESMVGTVSVSVRDIDSIAFMDRISLLMGESIYTQTAYPKMYGNSLFTFLDYTATTIECVYLFESANTKLKLLQEGIDYTINENKLILSTVYHSVIDPTISIRYAHKPQFHIIDLPRDLMVSSIRTQTGEKVKAPMPIHGVARRAHYVLDRQNFEGDLYFNNSFTINICT